MTSSTSLLRRVPRWLALAPALLVLLAPVLGAFHHHEGGASHAPCAVCLAGHAPAVTSAMGTTAAEPAPTPERVSAAPALEPRARAVAIESSRAPPLA